MPRIFALLFLTLATALSVAAPAGAATFGYGDQSPELFGDQRWKDLPLKETRRNVDWNTNLDPVKTAQLDAWMAAAQAAGARPLLAIDRNWTIPRTKKDKGPSTKQYTTLIKFLKGRYPQLKQISPWNEANFNLQPTFKDPKKAWNFYNIAKKNCKGCTVTSPVVLPGKNGVNPRWLAQFLKLSKGKIKLWAFHNYGDLNRGSEKTLTQFEKQVKGNIWITEAAGWVKFGENFSYDEVRAAKAIDFTFKTAKKHKRVKRVYFYEWRGKANVDPDTRWDSGVINSDGTARPGYDALVRGLKK